MRRVPLIALLLVLLVAGGVGIGLVSTDRDRRAPVEGEGSAAVAAPHARRIPASVPAAEPIHGEAECLVTVVRADTGSPVVDADLRLHTSAYCPASEGRSDDAGRCVLARQPILGTLRVLKSGFVQERIPVRPEDGVVTVRLVRLGDVRGTVVAAWDGRGLPGVPVVMWRSRQVGEAGRTATSAADGSFAFADVAPGLHYVYAIGAGVASAPFPAGSRWSEVQVWAAATSEVEVRVSPTAPLRGRVTDAAGLPIAGAVVDYVSWPCTLPVTTAADGRFEIAARPPRDEADVAASRDGYRDAWVPLPEGTESVELVLTRVRSIAALVSDEQGRPVAGAHLAAYADDPSRQEKRRTGRAETDDDGRASIVDVGPGAMDVDVSKPGCRPVQIAVAAEGPDSLEVVLSSGRTTHGRLVLGAPGAVLEQIRTQVWAEDDVDDSQGWRPQMSVAPDLSFEAVGLGVGPYVLRVTGTLADARTVEGEVRAESGARDVLLPLTIFGDPADVRPPLAVMATANGRPVARARVLGALEDEHGPEFEISAPLRDGVALLPRGVRDISTVLVVDAADAFGNPLGVPPSTARVPGDTDAVTVVLPEARTLHGRVVDSAGRPLAGLPVHASLDFDIQFTGDASDAEERFSAWRAVTAADGTFAIAGILNVAYEVFIEGDAHRADWSETIEPADRRLEIVVTSAPRTTVRFVDERGDPIEGVEVTAPFGSPRDADGGRIWSVTTGPDGTAVLFGVPLYWTIHAAPPEREPPLRVWEGALSDAADTPITLYRKRTLAGLVRHTDGRPLPHVVVVFETADGLEASEFTDAAGRYEIRDAPQGGGTVSAHVLLISSSWEDRVVARADVLPTDHDVDLVVDADALIVLRPIGALREGSRTSRYVFFHDVATRRRIELPALWSPSGMTLAAGRRGAAFDVFVAGEQPAHARRVRAGEGVTEIRPASDLGELRVRVLLDGLAPPPGTRVEIDDGAVEFHVYEGAGANFARTGVPAGTWRVTARARRGDVRYRGEAHVTTGVAGAIDLLPEE